MLFLKLLQISVLISTAITTPNLGKALLHFNEARARALAQRARARANSARLHAQLPQSTRPKRYSDDDFDQHYLDAANNKARFHHHHQVFLQPIPVAPPALPHHHHHHHTPPVPPPIHHHQYQHIDHHHPEGITNQGQIIHKIRKDADDDVSGQVFDPFDQRDEVLRFFEEYNDEDPAQMSDEGFNLRSGEPLGESIDNLDKFQSFYLFRAPPQFRRKRSLALTRLITDPSVKLDVPKTMENFGTVTKHAFEDEHTPIFHVKNLLGSSKNTLLSAMRIPPQHLIIPSKYHIVKDDEESRSNDDGNGIDTQFDKTFQRVGQMIRGSIQSSQDTIAHLNDMAHDARNIIHTSRHALPKLILPYSQVAAVQNTRKPAILITPRIIDFAEKRLGATPMQTDNPSDFIRLGHIMDAVGLSKPDRKKIDYEKIEFQPKKSTILQAKNRILPKLLQRFKDDNLETVTEAVSALKDAKVSVGARNLRDFLVKMKHELTEEKPVVKPQKNKLKKRVNKKIEDRELTKFIEHLFNDIKVLPKNETVGLRLSPALERPFMGSASKTDLKKFLELYNDDPDNDEILQDFAHYLEHKDEMREADEIGQQHPDVGDVLGAINPLMFERMYNESLKLEHNALHDPKPNLKVNDKIVGTSMTMGHVLDKKAEEFLENFNDQRINEVED